MLEKPDLQDDAIAACLQEDYGLRLQIRGACPQAQAQVTFLPLGADQNTAVYRAVADNGLPYFVKLREGNFDEIAVTLPAFLSSQGIREIIAPLPARTGRLWSNLDAFKVILYPFVEGHNAYEIDLSDNHWVALGAALRRIHAAAVPSTLAGCIPKETYSPRWRDSVRSFLARIENAQFADPVAAELAVFLRARRAETLDLVGRAGHLAALLQACSTPLVVCHSDIHAGNVLIDAGAALYIVDWDQPILALKERDLMYAGGGQFANRRTPEEEERLFYRGYGPTIVDPFALAYYRYERIVEDIAVFCEQLLLSDKGGPDREQSLQYLESNFLPGNTIEIAYQADRTGIWA